MLWIISPFTNSFSIFSSKDIFFLLILLFIILFFSLDSFTELIFVFGSISFLLDFTTFFRDLYFFFFWEFIWSTWILKFSNSLTFILSSFNSANWAFNESISAFWSIRGDNCFNCSFNILASAASDLYLSNSLSFFLNCSFSAFKLRISFSSLYIIFSPLNDWVSKLDIGDWISENISNFFFTKGELSI